jgi:hypothetical protein
MELGGYPSHQKDGIIKLFGFQKELNAHNSGRVIWTLETWLQHEVLNLVHMFEHVDEEYW